MTMKLLDGGRVNLEMDLLDAILQDDRQRVDKLKSRLVRQESRLHLVKTDATSADAASISVNPSSTDDEQPER